ncbi:hypothetical protein AGMMS49525_09990 [Bacteroidia bacterium]|nr:hypothetical protein AGMMS49525_09990 [Bacteroidia bacterium]
MSGAAYFTSASATQFTTSPTVPEKTAAITVAAGTRAIATEAQVYNSIRKQTDGFRDTVRKQDMAMGGAKTFDGTLQASGTLSASGNATFSGTATFSSSPTVSSRNTAVTGITPLTQTTVATEAQVYATAKGITSDALLAFRDSTLTKDQTLNGVKTFLKDPQFPTKTPKFVLIYPNTTNGPPTFRALLATDIPTLNQSTTGNAATATALSAGTDRTKLDGIATGATKNDPSATNPLANGTAAPGPVAAYSRGDHVHPTQVSTVLTGGSTTLAPSVKIVSDSLAVKLNRASSFALTGDVTVTSANLDIGSFGATLANSGVANGTWGTNSTTALTPAMGETFSVSGFATDLKGRVTSATTHTERMPNDVPTSKLAGIIADAQMPSKGTAGKYGPDSNATLAYSGTFSVPYMTTDAYGRVTAEATRIMTMPGPPTTAQSLASVGTINVSGTATASTGGITTTYAPTYTNGGNVVIQATVPAATSSVAGALTPPDYNLLRTVDKEHNGTGAEKCALKFGTSAQQYVDSPGTRWRVINGITNVVAALDKCRDIAMVCPSPDEICLAVYQSGNGRGIDMLEYTASKRFLLRDRYFDANGKQSHMSTTYVPAGCAAREDTVLDNAYLQTTVCVGRL